MKVVIAVMVVVLVFLSLHLSVIYQQRRAYKLAGEVRGVEGGEMVELYHLARCISFNSVFGTELSRKCFELAENVIARMEEKGDENRLRVARSTLFGAINISSHKEKFFEEKKRQLHRFAVPTGSHPIRFESIRSAEPFSFVGSLAGFVLFGWLTYFLGLEGVFLKGRKSSRWSSSIIFLVATISFILFVVFMFLA